MIYCPSFPFCHFPVIRIDLCVISWKTDIFLNFISCHIFTIYVGGASLRLPAPCRLIAVSGARLSSVDGLVVWCLKMHRHVKPVIAICLQFISNMFTIDTCIQAHWGSAPVFFSYKKLRHQGFMQTGLTLIPVWICNYIDYKLWDELLIDSQTLTVAPLKFGHGISNFNQYFTRHVITYPCWDYS